MSVTTNKFIRFIELNANSIVSQKKREELKHLIRTKMPSFVLLCETKLNASHKLTFPEYNFYRNDRSTISKGGGTAILVKDIVKHEVLNTPKLTNMEATCVKIQLDGASFTIVSIYCTTKVNERDLDTLLDLDEKVLITGDFNAKHMSWNNDKNNSRGVSLFKYLQKYPEVSLHFPLAATCTRSKISPSTIDLILTKGLNIPFTPEIGTFESDHNPVIFSVMLENNLKYEQRQSHFNFKAADWYGFRSSISSSLSINNEISNETDIDTEVARFTSIISMALEKYVPKKTYTSNNDIPSDIISIIERKNKMRRQHHNCNNQTTKRKMKSEINRMNKMIKEMLDLHRDESMSSKLNNIECNADMFKKIKAVTNQTNNPIPALINSNGLLISNLKDKANLIAAHFEKVHSQNASLGCAQHEADVNEAVQDFLNTRPPIPMEHEETNFSEIRSAIKKLKNKKSSGTDKIPNIALKHLPANGIEFLVKLANNILRLSYFPKEWKNANIIPVLKPDKPADDVQSYRPISLLCSLSKVIERIIFDRLTTFAHNNNVIPSEQFGFRRKHSTVHALLNLTEKITAGFNRKLTTIALFLDIEKAFDTVWFNGLVFKLINLKFPEYLTRLISNYLAERTFKVCVNDEQSDVKAILAGAPQGSVLAPLLYSLYLYDIPMDPTTNLSMFADDTSISSASMNPRIASRNIQRHANQIARYLKKWKVKINAGKTEAVIFRYYKKKYKARQSPLPLFIDDCRVDYKDKVKYLGYMLKSNLKPNAHIERILGKGYAGLRKLYPLMKPNSGLSTRIKCRLYTTIIRPAITHAIPIWLNHNKTLGNKLKILENKCLRLAISDRRTMARAHFISTRNLHMKTSVPHLNVFMQKLTKSFLMKTYEHENAIIRTLGNHTREHLMTVNHKPAYYMLTQIDQPS